MNLPSEQFDVLLGAERNDGLPPLVNVGIGEDINISDLALMICQTVGYTGQLVFDRARPDGTPRKLLDSGRLSRMGWKAKAGFREGLARVCRDFTECQR